MEELTPGMKVKMTQEFKDSMMLGESREHILEFGDCVGIVGERYFDWPEFQVYWQPSNLNYLYLPEDLDEYIETDE